MSLGSPALDRAYDKWLTTPPEDELPDTQCHCYECGNDIYPGEIIYRLEDGIYCEDCGKEWLNQFMDEATEEECFEE